jgi:peptidoglycan/LPS O-acetylase OafA/YrhL
MSTSRLGNIDALRAVAALSVFVQHAFRDVIARGGDGPFAGFAAGTLNTIDTGRLGVVMFFLISGFVIPFSIKGDRPVRRFVISRLFRLYPAYWVSLIAVTVLLTLTGHVPSLAQVLANGSMAATILGEEWMNGVYWTLFIELLFYGMTVMLFVMGVLYQPILLAGFAGLLALTTDLAIIAPDLPLPVQYIGLHLSVMFSGLLLRLGLVEGRRSALFMAGLLFVFQMASVVLASDYALQTEHGFAAFSMTSSILAYVLGFGVFVAVAVFGRQDTRFLAHMAAVSYSFYLLHAEINAAVFHFLPLTGQWSDLIALGVGVALGVAVASVVYRLVEQPSMALGRRINGSTRPITALG